MQLRANSGSSFANCDPSWITSMCDLPSGFAEEKSHASFRKKRALGFSVLLSPCSCLILYIISIHFVDADGAEHIELPSLSDLKAHSFKEFHFPDHRNHNLRHLMNSTLCPQPCMLRCETDPQGK